MTKNKFITFEEVYEKKQRNREARKFLLGLILLLF
ncbi:UNVERIFIED_ORG: hypothetical protein QFZ59_001820 [Bacillus sp. B2I3]|nr:hypothetical protein [Bacillus sp. B2I3]